MFALSATLLEQKRRASETVVVDATAVIAGLLVGLTECLFFALTLARMPIQGVVWPLLGWNATQYIQPVSIGVVVITPVVAGVGFGLLLRQRPRSASGLRWWRFGVVGPILWLSSAIGLVIGAAFLGLAANQGDAGLQLVFRSGFTLASTIAALLCTGATALTLRLERPMTRAFLVAVVTGGTYLVVTSLLGLMPNWHVGSGDMAMPRIAMVANLLAGTIGGATAFRLLSR